jgi:RNA polymerase sigma-70 factor (ECF subfamily)
METGRKPRHGDGMSATRSDVRTDASDLQEAAARVARSAGSVPAAVIPSVLGKIETALGDLSSACYKLGPAAADQPSGSVSREQKALALSTVHEAGASVSRAASCCRAAEATLALAFETSARDARVEAESQHAEVWIESLRSAGRRRNDAIWQLYELMLRAARFELSRRRSGLSHVGDDELTDITLKAAADALESVLAHLDDFPGTSRFTTWASKFAVTEASIRFRRLAWQDREVVMDVESTGLPETLRQTIADALSPQERKVFVSVALNRVPIDVLAERIDTSRGVLHASLHGARGKLRSALAATQVPDRSRSDSLRAT